MAVLGILSCQIFELELAYLLAAQETPPRITVVRNAASQGFINAVIGYQSATSPLLTNLGILFPLVTAPLNS